jgi:ribulose-phosphate 3-epimerase
MEKMARPPIRIAPSILNADHGRLREEIERVATTSDLLHLDVMDNIFVPNFTFDFEQCSIIIASSPLPVDSHLMIAEPDRDAPRFAEMGSRSVTFHLEAAKDVRSIIRDVTSNGSHVAIAIKPGTSFSEVEPFLGEISMLLVMTVEPGFGGQSFMPEMMPKVQAADQWRLLHPERDLRIEVDGGVSLATIEEASLSGADTFVAGSAVFKADIPSEMVTQLRLAAENVQRH